MFPYITGLAFGLVGPLVIVLSSYLCFAANLDDMAAMDECTAVSLRLSGGWWIRINSDGSGSYGFGTLPARVRVMQGAFPFEDVLAETRRIFPRKPKNAEEPYMAVSCWKQGSTSAEEHPLAQDPELIAELFRIARDYTAPPSTAVEQGWQDRIESFWEKDAPVLPDTPQTADGK